MVMNFIFKFYSRQSYKYNANNNVENQKVINIRKSKLFITTGFWEK